MRIIVVLSLLLAGCSSIKTYDKESNLELIHAGVFLANQREIEYINDPNSTSGVRSISDPSIVCTSKEIPMKLGVTFGVYYKIKGYPESHTDIPVVVETSHPEIISSSGSRSSLDIWESDTSHYSQGGHVGGALFTFEGVNELKPGHWSITVKAEGTEIIQEFNVSGDNYLDLSSCHKI
ncbi:DUF3859 domain-containing protein [Microbulbifer sp. PSTR4-B]|uniref:DUF3859 domain-containing protein n=1 Tax=Microbulbifer sp. PSTR4-B TaxID=3243396 RepID=UPI00403A3C6C